MTPRTRAALLAAIDAALEDRDGQTAGSLALALMQAEGQGACEALGLERLAILGRLAPALYTPRDMGVALDALHRRLMGAEGEAFADNAARGAIVDMATARSSRPS